MSAIRVSVKPELLEWAVERAGARGAKLREMFPKLPDWLAGKTQPTLKELERFAGAARVRVGYLFLPSPPVERMPISDLRTVQTQAIRRPSPDLLDIIRLCQRRQDWYREYAARIGNDPLAFVGSVSLDTAAEEAADQMQKELGFAVADRHEARSIEDALRLFIDKTEAAGVLVMASGVVGTHTRRKLDPQEFRGFALADQLAPLVFVNSVDAEAAQMFTLAHELAHIWLGSTALSDAAIPVAGDNRTEQWCNRVAAEFLVPLESLRGISIGDPLSHIDDYVKLYKVSRLVILRRLLDAGVIDRDEFKAAYVAASRAYQPSKPEDGEGGGSFYNTFPRSASKRLIRSLYLDAVSGETPYGDALKLLGFGKVDTFRELAKRLGVA